VEERTVVRTWGPRGTLHLLATEDIGWLLPLLGPFFIAGNSRRYAQLGLDPDTIEQGLRAIQTVLAEQAPLTRDELIERLRGEGVRVEGQARPHLLGHAAFKGLICYGPDRGKNPTYVLLRDWVNRGNPLPEEEAQAELARRYLEGHGPASPQDLAAWSGLPMRVVRSAWSRITEQLVEVEINGSGSAWMPEAHLAWLDEPLGPGPIVRLLPNFDPYLLGYQTRDFVVSREYAKRINAGGGMLHPTVLVNGRAAGIWKREQTTDYLDITVEPFGPLAPEVPAKIEAEAADLARFLGTRARPDRPVRY
jgi:hypothetical protein